MLSPDSPELRSATAAGKIYLSKLSPELAAASKRPPKMGDSLLFFNQKYVLNTYFFFKTSSINLKLNLANQERFFVFSSFISLLISVPEVGLLCAHC